MPEDVTLYAFASLAGLLFFLASCVGICMAQKNWLRRVPVILYGLFWGVFPLAFGHCDYALVRMCYGSAWIMWTFVAVMVGLTLLSVGAARSVFATVPLWGLCATLALGTAFCLLQNNDFQVRCLTHSRYSWSTMDYLQVLGTNMLTVFIPAAAVFMFLFPWRHVLRFGLTRMLCLGVAWMSLQYMMTGVLFLRFATYGVE